MLSSKLRQQQIEVKVEHLSESALVIEEATKEVKGTPVFAGKGGGVEGGACGGGGLVEGDANGAKGVGQAVVGDTHHLPLSLALGFCGEEIGREEDRR